MSRVAKNPITVPDSVKVNIENSNIQVSGTKGTLDFQLPQSVSLKQEENVITVQYGDSQESVALAGTTRALINNMVIGVSEKFKRHLQMVGVGYRSQVLGNTLTLNVGYSHPVTFVSPPDIEFKVEANTNIFVSGINKEKVGLLASQIRSIRPPEPYKGKGIRYNDEKVLKKAGKSGK